MKNKYNDEYEEALAFSDGDEEFAALPEQHRFIIPESARWDSLRETSTNIGAFIQKALRTIEKSNQRLYGVFGDAQWTNEERLPDHLLASLVEHFFSNKSLKSRRNIKRSLIWRILKKLGRTCTTSQFPCMSTTARKVMA